MPAHPPASFRPTRRAVLFLGSGVLLAPLLHACTTMGGGVRPVAIPDPEGRINALRARHGLAPLAREQRLQSAAERQAHAMAQRDTLSHELSADMEFSLRMRRVGFAGMAAENLSAGRPDLDNVLNGWLGSPVHRANLLNPDFARFGVAAARVPPAASSRYGIYWAMVFGA